MMNKTLFFALVLLMLGNVLWCDLHKHYKKGTLFLKAVEGFGEGNDWEELFYKPYKDMMVAPDGSIFIANSRTDNIYKFDQKGKLLKTFGRKGEGPGDFYLPGDLTLLDNKYIVVSEYASRRRFSLWDLNGKYVKIVKTKTAIFQLTALRNNRVAYYYISRHPKENNGYHETYNIVIKDITGGEEKLLKKISLFDRSSIKLEPRGFASYDNFFGEVYLAQTINGNLALGVSNRPKINIFSPTGKLIHSFDLKIPPIPVNESYIKKFKDGVMGAQDGLDEKTMDASEKYNYKTLNRALKKLDFSILFDKHLPLYKEMLVDSEGNFLIFKFTECRKDCDPIFQVYSKEGTYICETMLDRGKYDVDIDRRFRKLRFTSQGIFGLFAEKDDEDGTLKLIKSNY